MSSRNPKPTNHLDDSLSKLIEARQHDPWSILGHCQKQYMPIVRAFIPFCESVQIGPDGPIMERILGTDIFEYDGQLDSVPEHYQLYWRDRDGNQIVEYDPYTFSPVIPEFDLQLFQQGKHWHIYRILGAHAKTIDGIAGVQFSVWAPNAERVSIVADFNRWDGRRHPMQSMGASGVWTLFIPGVAASVPYKYEIRNRHSGEILEKADPYGQRFEMRPKNASVVSGDSDFKWSDETWIQKRADAQWLHTPMSIYEVHLGSWQRDSNGGFLGYRELAERLIAYVKELGFTHIELLPISEHPLDDSWGYQCLGYFAPSARFGSPDDFRYMVDLCHSEGIGVLLDWVPAHFPKDEHGLVRFDGTAVYEHEDSRLGEHPDWGTLIYNFGRDEVRNFLLASAVYWLEEFHLDGLRVDAVASLLYLDYSRKEGEWLPNRYGGNENLEAIEFIRELNSVTHGQFPGTLILAEESTSWPQVTKPASTGGLGFSMKWNMGWMHDILEFMKKEPVHRKFHHDSLTFGLLYAFSENFVLPFSHDEVVHGKGSLLAKMPGDEWQRFANLRLLLTFMFTYPGKKLLFMGCEFGQGTEWNHNQTLDWYVLDYPLHRGVRDLVSDLNALYLHSPELHYHDFEEEGFQWVDCSDHDQSVISYLRKVGDQFFVVVFNFTPVVRKDYRIGVPHGGRYKELLNSDSTYYGGSNVGNAFEMNAQEIAHQSLPYSLTLTLPPLAGVVLRPE